MALFLTPRLHKFWWLVGSFGICHPSFASLSYYICVHCNVFSSTYLPCRLALWSLAASCFPSYGILYIVFGVVAIAFTSTERMTKLADVWFQVSRPRSSFHSLAYVFLCSFHTVLGFTRHPRYLYVETDVLFADGAK